MVRATSPTKPPEGRAGSNAPKGCYENASSTASSFVVAALAAFSDRKRRLNTRQERFKSVQASALVKSVLLAEPVRAIDRVEMPTL
jgi:hypothetical protein